MRATLASGVATARGARVLVVHASRSGSTAEVADAIAEVLRDGGAAVDLAAVADAPAVAGYDAVVLGSAIWAGRPLPEAVQFVRNRRVVLERMPIAYFALCEKLREDTPANRAVADHYLDALVAIVPPAASAVFAGARKLHGTHPIIRWLLERLGVREGDWRNWPLIRSWAAGLLPRLTPTHA